MTPPSEGVRSALVGVACIALLAVAVWSIRREPARPSVASASLEELDTLRRYSRPVEAPPQVDDYEAFLPAEASSEPVPREGIREAPLPRLSAILISGAQPLAIIDDRTVRGGERLEHGWEVVSIGSDHVVLRDSFGTLRTVRLGSQP